MKPRRRARTAATRARRSSPGAAKMRQHLMAELEALTPRDRHVLALLLVERMSEREAGQALGVPAPMVHRGFVALMRKLRRATERFPGTDRPATRRNKRMRRAS